MRPRSCTPALLLLLWTVDSFVGPLLPRKISRKPLFSEIGGPAPQEALWPGIHPRADAKPTPAPPSSWQEALPAADDPLLAAPKPTSMSTLLPSTPPQGPSLSLQVGGMTLPHPEKGPTGGEDAYFFMENLIGVFDGVGGWRRLGYDPSAFTRSFAARVVANVTAQRRAESPVAAAAADDDRGYGNTDGGAPTPLPPPPSYPPPPPGRVDLRKALAHAAATAAGIGSCTACLASFDPESGDVAGLNLGDSGALLLRRERTGQGRNYFVAYRTQSQQHRFNQPYQLGTNSTDTVEMADPFLFPAREGDVVVLATDGVLDNMFDDDIAACLKELSEKGPSRRTAPAVARAITLRAFNLSIDRSRESPFQRAAARTLRGWGSFERALRRRLTEGRDGGISSGGGVSSDSEDAYRGGKLDDITVVVGIVQRQMGPPGPVVVPTVAPPASTA